MPNRYYGVEGSPHRATLRRLEAIIEEQETIIEDLCYCAPQMFFPSEIYEVRVLRIQKRRYAKPVKAVNIYPKTGPARGLIKIIRKFYGPDGDEYLCGGLDLIKYAVKKAMPPGAWDGMRIGGSCRWCLQPTETKRRQWCKNCITWYLAATGSVKPPAGRSHKGPFWKNTRWREYESFDGKKHRRKEILCCECKNKPYDEVDHLLALSIAWELKKRGDRKWYRAWTPQNLRPLCYECHAKKTREDRALLAKLQRGEL